MKKHKKNIPIKTEEQQQEDFNKVTIDAVRKYVEDEIKKIPLVNGIRDPEAVAKLWRRLQELSETAVNYYIKIDRQVLFETTRKFRKTPEQLSEMGKKGARKPKIEMIEDAKKIITAHPINKNLSFGKIRRWLNTHGLSCSKQWVSDHIDEIFPTI